MQTLFIWVGGFWVGRLPFISWCFLSLFQGFSGFGRERKSLASLRFSLIKPRNQGKEGQGTTQSTAGRGWLHTREMGTICPFWRFFPCLIAFFALQNWPCPRWLSICLLTNLWETIAGFSFLGKQQHTEFTKFLQFGPRKVSKL